jgi:hypothetical protein
VIDCTPIGTELKEIDFDKVLDKASGNIDHAAVGQGVSIMALSVHPGLGGWAFSF